MEHFRPRFPDIIRFPSSETLCENETKEMKFQKWLYIQANVALIEISTYFYLCFQLDAKHHYCCFHSIYCVCVCVRTSINPHTYFQLCRSPCNNPTLGNIHGKSNTHIVISTYIRRKWLFADDEVPLKLFFFFSWYQNFQRKDADQPKCTIVHRVHTHVEVVLLANTKRVWLTGHHQFLFHWYE